MSAPRPSGPSPAMTNVLRWVISARGSVVLLAVPVKLMLNCEPWAISTLPPDEPLSVPRAFCEALKPRTTFCPLVTTIVWSPKETPSSVTVPVPPNVTVSPPASVPSPVNV